MRLHRHDSHSLIAFGLLVVFVLGGLLVPTLHRVQHGVAWAELRGEAATAEACDHSRHGDGFEATLPAFHEDLCALCTRPLVSLLHAPASIQARQVFASLLAQAPSFVAGGSDAFFSIRAPPFAA